LNQGRIKRSFGILPIYVPVFPVVLGYQSRETKPVQRRAPEILVWR
jgi:hypothetical protein